MPEIQIKRSNRRTVSLEVNRDCQVVVHAPLRMPMKDIEAFVKKNEQWLQNAVKKQNERAEKHPEPTEEEKKALIAQLKEILPGKIEYYSGLMGVVPAAVTITGAKTRFGSCSSKNRLSFSFRLAQYPQEAIDYVVVHELAHIRHHNHSAEFYAFVASVMPDYKEREKLLKD